MRHLLINKKTKEVENTIVLDVGSTYIPRNDYILIKSELGAIGDIYENGEFINPNAPLPPTLAEVKVDKLAEINQMRDEKLRTDGAEFAGDVFDIDDTSKMNITGLIVASSMLPDEHMYTYRSQTNQNHELTKTQLAKLGIAISMKVDEIYKKSWDLKAEVDKATTLEEVEAIEWDA